MKEKNKSVVAEVIVPSSSQKQIEVIPLDARHVRLTIVLPDEEEMLKVIAEKLSTGIAPMAIRTTTVSTAVISQKPRINPARRGNCVEIVLDPVFHSAISLKELKKFYNCCRCVCQGLLHQVSDTFNWGMFTFDFRNPSGTTSC